MFQAEPIGSSSSIYLSPPTQPEITLLNASADRIPTPLKVVNKVKNRRLQLSSLVSNSKLSWFGIDERQEIVVCNYLLSYPGLVLTDALPKIPFDNAKVV